MWKVVRKTGWKERAEQRSAAHQPTAQSHGQNLDQKTPSRKRTNWKSSVEKRYLLNRMTEDERAI